MVVDFRFHGGRQGSTSGVKVEVAAGTPISVFQTSLFAKFAFGLFYLFRIICLFIKENKWMGRVQGMVQPKG